MSGVAVIVAKLKAHAPLTAVVASARIMAGNLPLNTALPAISVTQISSVPRNTVSMADSEFNTDRVQVTVMAKTYPSLRSILRLVLAACPHTRGTVNGIACDSITPEAEGPDFSDEELTMVAGSRDFNVTWTA